MKYKEIKETLLKNGFTLKYFQTSGNLDMLHFFHPKIKGEINIDFDYNYPLPQNILDGEEFNYLESEFLNEIHILSVEFRKDKSRREGMSPGSIISLGSVNAVLAGNLYWQC